MQVDTAFLDYIDLYNAGIWAAMFKTGILVNPDVIGLMLLIQNKQREFVMLTEGWSVFLY